MKLYEINSQIENLIDEIGEEEISSSLAQKLDALELQRSEKIQNICLLYKNMQSLSDAISNEVKNLQQKKKYLDNKMERLKDYLASNLSENEKIDGPNYSISWRKSDSLIIDPILFDELKFYKEFPQYCKVKIDIDKTAVKKFIKTTNVSFSGLSIEEKNNIQIK